MNTIARIGQPAPELQLEAWLQGEASRLRDHLGKVILIEVFQVNCTGCFVHALPEAIRLHELLAGDDFVVLGVATAFENFDINTLENLQRLLSSGEMVGEPLRQLANTDYLKGNKLDYRLPFAIAMDKLVENREALSEEKIQNFIASQIPDFNRWPQAQQAPVYQQAREYLQARTHHALTFESYQLQGTPSYIVIDKHGLLRHVSFGMGNQLETLIRQLLAEKA